MSLENSVGSALHGFGTSRATNGTEVVRLRLFPLSLAACLGVSACADVEDDGGLEATDEQLVAGSVLAVARTGPCSTSGVLGLSEQLVEELACLHHVPFERIDGVPNLTLAPSAAVLPYLQAPAAAALKQAAASRPIHVTSALRTVAQQFVLLESKRRCGYARVGEVGSSGHEDGLAVDVSMGGKDDYVDTALLRTLERRGYDWMGISDHVHFDFSGRGGADLDRLSVRAFQRLWNRNNPNAQIPVDGVFKGPTEAKLRDAPAAGFPIGARCDEAVPTK